MSRLTKRQVLDRYYGERRLSNAARVLSNLVRLVEDKESVLCLSPQFCPNCDQSLFEIHIEPRFTKVFTFCKHCHYFICHDRLGRVMSFASEFPDESPVPLPPRRNPRKPLERSIWNHLQSIKKESHSP